MKKNTIKKNRIRRDCWSLDGTFIRWLNEHLKVYLRDADKVVDLDYHKFNYKGKECTQKELIIYLIRITDDLIPMDNWDEEYGDLCNEMLDIWKLIFPAMWW